MLIMKNILLAIAVLLILSLPSCRTATVPPPPHVLAAFERSKNICRDIEKIRGLAFKKEIATKVQSLKEFRAYVEESIARQYGGAEGTEGYVQGLVKIGVLECPVNLTSTILTLVESQVAAHYDPESKVYYLLMTNMPAIFLDTVSSHELCHAMQDQHFDLHAFLEKDLETIRANGDFCLAKQCLVEGEATFVMTVWMIMSQMGVDDHTLAEPMASIGINCQAAMDLDGILAMSKTRLAAMGSGFETMAEAMKELQHLPRFLVESLFASYIQGALMVDYIRTRGGWKAVEELYKRPPQSTEQVLHPEKLTGQRDVPFDVHLPGLIKSLPRGWRLQEEDVLGELGMRIFFQLWQAEGAEDPSAAASAAAGWGGDRYYYFVNRGAGKDLLIWKTVWDTPQEAAEFTVAYRVALASRFPALNKAWRSGAESAFKYQIWEIEPGRFLKLMRKNEVVGIIDTTDRAGLDILWK